jgi:uncharacterized protein
MIQANRLRRTVGLYQFQSPPTAFVREVVLPGGPYIVPQLEQRHCRFKLECHQSSIHRWGVFAAEPIPAQRRVIEYTGQKIDYVEARRRSIRHHVYLFWLNDIWAIDGAIGGSGAQFINHSCDPNLVARVRGGRIFLVSRRQIATGDELTLDYHLEGDGPEIRCSCGSKACKGSL